MVLNQSCARRPSQPPLSFGTRSFKGVECVSSEARGSAEGRAFEHWSWLGPKRPGSVPERALARVCREAGATMRCNTRLCDMNVLWRRTTTGPLKFLQQDSQRLFFRAQLVLDITLRCALAADGTAHPGAARIDGVVCRAHEDKETKYSELLRKETCRLVVVALETGGRWSEEALQFEAEIAVSVMRLFLHQFVGGHAFCVACPRREMCFLGYKRLLGGYKRPKYFRDTQGFFG